MDRLDFKAWLYAIVHPTYVGKLIEETLDQEDLLNIRRGDNQRLQRKCDGLRSALGQCTMRKNGLQQELALARASHEEAMQRLRNLGQSASTSSTENAWHIRR